MMSTSCRHNYNKSLSFVMAATRNINRQPREYITRDLNQVQREIASVIKILNEIMNNKYLRSRLYDMALKFRYVDLYILYNIHIPSSEQTSDHPAATETVQLEPCSDYALKNIHNFTALPVQNTTLTARYLKTINI